MRIHGLDFTSAPSRRKPLIAVGCDFDGGTLRPDTTEVQGAPRLLASAVSVEPCRPTGDNRVAVEAYPAVVARAFIGRKSYKRDGPDAPERRAARETLVSGLESPALRKKYGFGVALGGSWKKRFVCDPSADTLDSLLCAVQAAWAHTRRNEGWGVPEDCDREEGWILDPHLLDEDGSEANHAVRQ